MLDPLVEIVWEPVQQIPEAKSGKAVYFVKQFSNT
jgi:hypothetical protein